MTIILSFWHLPHPKRWAVLRGIPILSTAERLG